MNPGIQSEESQDIHDWPDNRNPDDLEPIRYVLRVPGQQC